MSRLDSDNLEAVLQNQGTSLANSSMLSKFLKNPSTESQRGDSEYFSRIGSVLRNLEPFYVKESLGKDRNPIRVYKVRTMRRDADKFLDLIKAEDFDASGKLANDPRIVPYIGTFLRKSFIDELPQLYNLVNGDLKTVGIRPHRQVDWNRLLTYDPKIQERALQQKPGFLGIQYAHPTEEGDVKDTVRHMNDYLDSYEENPLTTDLSYGKTILYNILTRNTSTC